MMLVLLALTACEALVAVPGAVHARSVVAQFGFFNKDDDSASKKAVTKKKTKGKQVKKAVKKSFFQKAEIVEEPESSPLDTLKSLTGLGFLVAVPGAAAVVVAGVILLGNGEIPDSLPFEFLNGFYPPAVDNKARVKAINIENKKKAKVAAEA